MINRFSGEYKWLSNFYPCQFELSKIYVFAPFVNPRHTTFKGILFSSVEHAYQAFKTENVDRAMSIIKMPTAADAKRAGRLLRLRPGWNDIKLRVMEECVRAKFEQNPDLARKLVDTHPHELIEGNAWGDRFWGVYNGLGRNHLGKILMKVREELMSKERGST